jgi:hypothetical protein
MAARGIGALLAAFAVSALIVSAAPAVAAIPPSGTVAEGVGPSGATIGSPGGAAVARWHLVCRPVYSGSRTRRCFSSLNRAINWVEIGGDGRVSAVVWGEGAWRTRRGVGLGSSIGAVKAAYGRSLKVRTTKVWTYLTLRRVIRGQVRVTGFLGRTKVGDIVQFYVTHERRLLVSADPATVPSGQGFSVVLTDFPPREPYEIELRLPWDSGFGVSLGRLAVGRNASGRLRVSSTGILAQAIARRPAGTTGPVLARIFAGGGVTAPRGTVRLALPGPPSIAVSPGVLPADGTAQLTVTGAEPEGRYELDAEWACPAGGTGRRQGVNEDEIVGPAGGVVVVAGIDASTINFGLFDEECAGAAPPATLPATLVLYRGGVGRGRAADSRERVATVTVEVARV